MRRILHSAGTLARDCDHRSGSSAGNPDHLVANIAAGAIKLSADELAILG